MLNRITKRALLVTVIGAIVAVLGHDLRGQTDERAGNTGRTKQAVSNRQAKQRMLNRAGLRAAASVTGSVTLQRKVTTDGSITSIEQLLKNSDLVLIGMSDSNRPWLTQDQRSIRSVFHVRIDKMLAAKKRGNGNRAAVEVIVPGGRFGFPERTWAQENTPGFLWPSMRETYMWFLRKATAEEQALVGNDGKRIGSADSLYAPVSGPMGVIHLTHRSGIARPSGGFENPLARDLVSKKVSSAMLIDMVNERIEQKER